MDDFATALTSTSAPATRILSHEFKTLLIDRLEGCIVSLEDDNLFRWKIILFGTPGTIFQGACFKDQMLVLELNNSPEIPALRMEFPDNFPLKPPSLRFVSEMWHPNVVSNNCSKTPGRVCMSIFATEATEMNGLHPSECWTPSRTVRSVLLSLVSLINEPNADSPANVDAANEYKQWKQFGTETYTDHIKDIVEKTKQIAEEEGVTVPTTMEAYKDTSLSLTGRCQSDDSDSDFE